MPSARWAWLFSGYCFNRFSAEKHYPSHRDVSSVEKTTGKRIVPIERGMGWHHSVIYVPGKNKWFIIYHRRPLGGTAANSPVVCIEEMQFGKDGKILPVKLSNEGVEALPLK